MLLLPASIAVFSFFLSVLSIIDFWVWAQQQYQAAGDIDIFDVRDDDNIDTDDDDNNDIDDNDVL